MSTLKIGKYLLIPFAIFISSIPVIDPFNVFTSLRNSAFDTFQIISPRQSQTKDNILNTKNKIFKSWTFQNETIIFNQ